MIWLIIFYGSIALILGMLFFWLSTGLTGLKRIALVIVLGLIVALGVLAFSVLLSRPKPINMELFQPSDVEVIGSVLLPNKGIYLWVRTDDKSMPRYYSMLWDREAAETLRELLRQKQRGQKLKIKPENILRSAQTTPLFYLTEPPTVPLKTPRGALPETFYYNPEQNR